jgi:hypothetical protein
MKFVQRIRFREFSIEKLRNLFLIVLGLIFGAVNPFSHGKNFQLWAPFFIESLRLLCSLLIYQRNKSDDKSISKKSYQLFSYKHWILYKEILY